MSPPIVLVLVASLNWLAGATSTPTDLSFRPTDLLVDDEYIVLFAADDATVEPAIRAARDERLVDELVGLSGGELRAPLTHTVRGMLLHTSREGAERVARHPAVRDVIQDRYVPALSANWPIDCGRAESGSSLEGYRTQTVGNPASPQVIDCPNPNTYCFDNWGLDRIDQRTLPRDASYGYAEDGTGVHVYVVDTGINQQHQELENAQGASRIGDGINFATLTVKEGAIADPGATYDCNYHGSHVASILGGRRNGVAKGVTLHPVRVAGEKVRNDPDSPCDGTARIAWLIGGFDWIARNHVKPAVVNVSINVEVIQQGAAEGSWYDRLQWIDTMEEVIRRLIHDYGIAVVTSAGNHNLDARAFTPSRMPEAIVVAGTDPGDYTWGRCDPAHGETAAADVCTNYGPTVDLYAPAEVIPGATWFYSNSVCRNSGTSWAAPHVTGVIARYLQRNPNATPADVEQYLISTATPNIVKGKLGAGTPNRLLYAPR